MWGLSAPIRDWTCFCISRHILIHWTTREVPRLCWILWGNSAMWCDGEQLGPVATLDPVATEPEPHWDLGKRGSPMALSLTLYRPPGDLVKMQILTHQGWGSPDQSAFFFKLIFTGVGASGKDPTGQGRSLNRTPGFDLSWVWSNPGFDPWVWKGPWKRNWHHTPVFLPGESHRQRSLASYSSQGCKDSDTTEDS